MVLTPFDVYYHFHESIRNVIIVNILYSMVYVTNHDFTFCEITGVKGRPKRQDWMDS